MFSTSLLFVSCIITAVAGAGLTTSSLETHVDSLTLTHSFKPVKESYWTGYPHHRRTPFAVSPDGKSAFLAYLDSSQTNVHVQQVDPQTFATVGATVTVTGAKEAGGLVAHNDGFALLTNEALPSGTTNAPAGNTPVPVLYRFTAGKQTFKTFLGGPGVHANFGLAASPDLNGDLVFSEASGLYGAYFVVTAYSGSAAGHFGDSIQYVKTDGTLTNIAGASSSWGCSHNTGIAFEAADTAPFASICAEDQGEIWLNTKTQGMSGVKISNENTTNGGSGEPMGGMSGSFSGLTRLIGKSSYVFAWVSRGAINLSANTWLGGGNTHAEPRTVNRNVAIAQFTDKNTLVGPAASSQIGAKDGDLQINWVTKGSADCSNAHVAAFNGESVLVTWEEISNPSCPFVAMGCKGTFTGTRFQLVTAGAKVGEPVVSTDTYVAGDMVTMADGRICWPYVSMKWDLSQAVPYGGSPITSTKMSFACVNLSGGSAGGAPAVSSNVESPSTSAVTTTPEAPSTTAAPSPVTSSTAETLTTTELGAVDVTTAIPGDSTTDVASPPEATLIEEISTTPIVTPTNQDTIAIPEPTATSSLETTATSVDSIPIETEPSSSVVEPADPTQCGPRRTVTVTEGPRPTGGLGKGQGKFGKWRGGQRFPNLRGGEA